jgi:predicted O-methyltransferase YrrM
MTQLHGMERRVNMLKIFARHYAEQLVGNSYPKSIDSFFAFMTVYEKQTLYRLAKSVPPKAALIEIGSYRGGSSCCLASGMAGKGSALHCVDTFASDAISGQNGEDTFTDFQTNTRPYAESIRVHRGYSHDVAKDFQPASVDLLFIDGDHSWEGVTTDLRLYVPFMKDNSILVMHDSAHPPVQRAIQDMVLPAEAIRLANLPNMYAARIHPGKANLAVR